MHYFTEYIGFIKNEFLTLKLTIGRYIFERIFVSLIRKLFAINIFFGMLLKYMSFISYNYKLITITYEL